MASTKKVTLQQVKKQIVSLAGKPEKVHTYIDSILPFLRGPSIQDFAPRRAYAGAAIEISGSNFSAARAENTVTVGGKPTMVVEASSTRLKVITDRTAQTGPVKVAVGVLTASGPFDFEVLPYPLPGSEQDGPPILFAGQGQGNPGDAPSTGTLKVLISLVNPSDTVPADPVAARDAVLTSRDQIRTFYDQASYGDLDVQIDILANWHTLTGDSNTYVDAAINNIGVDVLDRLMAEAAQAAVDENFDLNDYNILACVTFLDGSFIRAWGGWSRQNFTYDDDATNTHINIVLDQDINLLAIQESADWGRLAHEIGHSLVSVPTGVSASPGAATLGEDVYDSDLVDPDAETAADFEMMGNHDSHPLFSAFNMDQLGWYDAANINDDLQWDRNAFSEEFEVVAHGLAENAVAGRYHLLKIRVTDGLYYYVEVRQRPGATAQVFDEFDEDVLDEDVLDGAPGDGGVVVTKVLTDTAVINQQTRFITLLHENRVLKQDDVASDPARTLVITVLDDQVEARPLVCRVRVEWAQGIADDRNGAFDLRVEPWDANWQTPDVWVDRIPFGAFDQPNDAEGRPEGNGDSPRPLEINRFAARVHNDGSVGADNVRVTFYVITPPGVGDNGNWGPIQTKVVPNIARDEFADVSINWVPVVGEHTCLKVFAEQQLGEVTGGNNSAQENVFDFEAPAASVPAPVITPVAVRNPLDRRTIVYVGIKGVPSGYTVHFPHSWVWLEPLAERRLELTVLPTLDYAYYRERKSPRANVRVAGDIPRQYAEEILPGVLPGSRMLAIGGILARVTPKRKINIRLSEDKERSKPNVVALRGTIAPAAAGETVVVKLSDPQDRLRVAEVKTNSQGAFALAFDLTLKPSVEAKPKRRQKEEPLPGVYKAQAFTINSARAAQAASNIVIVKKRRGSLR
jgi:hypothetical protein